MWIQIRLYFDNHNEKILDRSHIWIPENSWHVTWYLEGVLKFSDKMKITFTIDQIVSPEVGCIHMYTYPPYLPCICNGISQCNARSLVSESVSAFVFIFSSVFPVPRPQSMWEVWSASRNLPPQPTMELFVDWLVSLYIMSVI